MNIRFDHKPATAGRVESYSVHCDELTGKSLGIIFAYDNGQCVYRTESWNPYASRRNRRSNRSRLFDSLEAAKAAAVAYVTRKVKQARDEQPVRYGHGQYFKIRTRWFYIHDFEAAGQHPSPQPALSKAHAKQCLQSIPSWVTAPVES